MFSFFINMTINKKTAEKNARANVMKIAGSPTNLPITPARPNNITAACNEKISLFFILSLQLLLMIGSSILIAIGIFFYLPADIISLAGEGAMQAIAEKTNTVFNKVKIRFDVTMVSVSLIACLIALRKLGAVGIGTIIASVLVGSVLGIVTKLFGQKRDMLLQG